MNFYQKKAKETRKLAYASTKGAVEALRDVAADENAPAAARVSAAKTLLEYVGGYPRTNDWLTIEYYDPEADAYPPPVKAVNPVIPMRQRQKDKGEEKGDE